MIIFFFNANKKMICVEGWLRKIPKFESTRNFRAIFAQV